MRNTLIIKILLAFGVCTSKASAQKFADDLSEQQKNDLVELHKINAGKFKRASQRGAVTNQ